MAEQKHFVFLEFTNRSGVSQKTGNDYHIRNISFADPETFENHLLHYHESLDHALTGLRKRDKILLETELKKPLFGNGVSEMVVVGVKKIQ